jgi:hypothetical protein
MAKHREALIDRVNDLIEVTAVQTRSRRLQTERKSRPTEETEEDKLVSASFGISTFPPRPAALGLHLVSE